MTETVAEGRLPDDTLVEVVRTRLDDERLDWSPARVVVGSTPPEIDTLDVELDPEPDTTTNEKMIGYVTAPAEL